VHGVGAPVVLGSGKIVDEVRHAEEELWVAAARRGSGRGGRGGRMEVAQLRPTPARNRGGLAARLGAGKRGKGRGARGLYGEHLGLKGGGASGVGRVGEIVAGGCLCVRVPVRAHVQEVAAEVGDERATGGAGGLEAWLGRAGGLAGLAWLGPGEKERKGAWGGLAGWAGRPTGRPSRAVSFFFVSLLFFISFSHLKMHLST
jgi:hypothetical protein